MTKPDFRKLYQNIIDAECRSGYWDGRRPCSPEPGPNRHPAYIHGFMNGRDDMTKRPRKTAAEIRSDWALIEAIFADEAGI